MTTGGFGYVFAINGNTQGDMATDWYAGTRAVAEGMRWRTGICFRSTAWRPSATPAP